MEFKQVITERRSIRKFTEETVDKTVIKELLLLALQAPSWKNSQCWEYVVVEDDKLKQILASTVPETNPASRCLKTAPFVVVAIADPDKVETPEGKQYYMADVASSFTIFWLACQDAGLGTVAVGEIQNEAVIKEALDIPMSRRIYAIAPVGVPLYQPKQRPRDEFDQKVSWGQYGKRLEK